MPTRKKNKSRLSKHGHVLVTLATLFVGGAVVACVVMAYVFVMYPSLHNRVATVAGESAEQWVVPVRAAAAAPAPTVSAASGIVVDVATGSILWERDATVVRPLASITKLITVSAYLATQPKLEATYTIPSDFHTNGITDVVEPGTGVSKLDVQAGERVTYRDLLAASLIGSANNASLALARTANLSAAALQRYAIAHGARTVQVDEASGLEPANVGSAQDVAVLAHVAFSNATIQTLASRASYHVTTGSGRGFSVRTTNALIGREGYQVVAGKTGYLTDAGYNLVVQARQDDHDVMLVLLGSPTSDDRFADADAMLQWVFRAYNWQVRRGGAILPL